MSLSKIGDDLQWQKISEKVSQRMATLESSPVIATMAKLQTSQANIIDRKREIEKFTVIAANKTRTAWQAALKGEADDGALAVRDQLRNEYQSLEEKERSNEEAMQEGRLALDAIKGKVCLEICDEIRPDYHRTVVSKARAAARAMLEVMEIEQRFVEQLLRCDVRIDHLRRVTLPTVLSRESLERFLGETAELG